MNGFRVPLATYRLQFNRDFKFAAAQALIPYLAELGITDIYASPLLKARKGGLHGYFVTNPMELSSELGSKRAFEALVKKLQSRGMGLIFDIVPNHMALSPDNPWWMEVLESGPNSPYALFFDIDWHPPNRLLEGKVLLPVLGRHFGEALEEQELKLTLEEGGFFVRYYDHKFPLDPKTYQQILTHRLKELTEELGGETPAIIALEGLISMITHLAPRTPAGARKAAERQRDKEIIKKNLVLLYRGSPEVKRFIDENLKIFNGTRGDPRSFDLLDHLLGLQPYRLAFWQVALEMINYRRFFSINDLIGMRIEDPRVFAAFKHGMLFRLVEEGKISGLRVDHIDGLYDPLDYLERLQTHTFPGEDPPAGTQNLYVVVEKILAPDESLPPEWPVLGTTGYDFLNAVNGVFVEKRGLKDLQGIYAKFIGEARPLSDLVCEKKKLIMAALFGGEVENHVFYLSGLASQDRRARDIHRQDLKEAMVEVMATLPVYRTYIRNFTVSPRDLAYLGKTFEEVGRRNPHLNQGALSFLKRVLYLDFPPYLTGDQKKEWLNFVMRWQQFTGPVMAKGVEDTLLYIYDPLISLNEVGGSFRAVPVKEFHDANRHRLESSRFTLSATSTHDTKRSEDVRARLNVLSEMPGEWQARLERWHAWNFHKKVLVQGELTPDRNQEVFLYQTMLGAWPLSGEEMPAFRERLRNYLIKAAREAMVHTRWVSPQVEHEEALLVFLDRILDEAGSEKFLEDFRQFQGRLAWYGALNSLSQVVLKAAAPGVPDFYQGTELWDFSLVDPDNRRPVDFERRSRFLREMGRQEGKRGKALISRMLANWQDGRLKLYVTWRSLSLRKSHPELFLEGDYLPLVARGERNRHVVAMARRREGDWLVAAAGRFFAGLAGPGQPPLGEVWGENALMLTRGAPGRWVDAFTGKERRVVATGSRKILPLDQLFQSLPVALLLGSG